MISNVKKALLKTSLVLVAVLMVFSSIPVMAATGGEVAPCAYYMPGPLVFSDSTQYTRSYDGKYMGVEVTPTSSTGNNENLVVSVYVDKTKTTHKYTIKTNGKMHKMDYIPLGNDGGSSVCIELSCSNLNAQITATVVSYSWD